MSGRPTVGVPLVACVTLLASMVPLTPRAEAAGNARPGVREECARDAEQAQRSRNAGNLVEARLPLLTCAQPTCPAVIRADCLAWLDEVTSATPSIVVHVRDPSDMEAVDASISVDGDVVAERVDGRAITLNPGEHRVECTRGGASCVPEVIRVVAGAKERPVTLRLAARAEPATLFPAVLPPAVPPQAEPAAVDAPPVLPPRERSTVNLPAWISLGVAVTALGTSAYLGATGWWSLRDLNNTCGNRCPPGSVSEASNRVVWADITLGVGAVAAGAATWFFLAARDTRARGTARASSLEVLPSSRGVALRWATAF